MPELYGIKFEYPHILTLAEVKERGLLWNNDFGYESYWEGNMNHYERLFHDDGQTYAPFTGLVYELRPDGTLWGYSDYVSGYKENEDTEFYQNGQIKKYINYNREKAVVFCLEWYENGQIKEISRITDHHRHCIKVNFDENGSAISRVER